MDIRYRTISIGKADKRRIQGNWTVTEKKLDYVGVLS